MGFMVRISTYIVLFYVLQWVIVSWVLFGMDLFSMAHGALNIGWYLLCVTLITGLCIYVSFKHGMKVNKFLARITSFRRRKKDLAKTKSRVNHTMNKKYYTMKEICGRPTNRGAPAILFAIGFVII